MFSTKFMCGEKWDRLTSVLTNMRLYKSTDVKEMLFAVQLDWGDLSTEQKILKESHAKLLFRNGLWGFPSFTFASPLQICAWAFYNFFCLWAPFSSFSHQFWCFSRPCLVTNSLLFIDEFLITRTPPSPSLMNPPTSLKPVLNLVNTGATCKKDDRPPHASIWIGPKKRLFSPMTLKLSLLSV